MSLLRPLKIRTTSLLRPVVASPKWNFPYTISLDIKTTPLTKPLLGSSKGGLMYFQGKQPTISTFDFLHEAFKWLVLLTSDYKVAGPNPIVGRILYPPKLHFIAQNLS